MARSGNAAGPPAVPANGPQADYPMVVGSPYVIAGVTYTPEDRLNYDEVGYVAADEAGGTGISAAHHTLPLPSYVEVTSLETGRTILVRVERRGPMNSDNLLALSPGALTQLGVAAGTPIRVRRVVPPEDLRAVLRAGQTVPKRMDTPMSLVEVLKRKLPARGSAPLQSVVASRPAAAPATPATATAPNSPPRPAPSTAVAAAPASQPATTPAAAAPALPSVASAPVVRTPASPGPITTTPVPASAAAVPTAPAKDFQAAFTSPAISAVAPAAPTPAPRAPAASTRPVAAPTAPVQAQPEPSRPAPAQAAPAPSAGNFVVQAAAFGSAARADRVARVVGGTVVQSGDVHRVRTGPFATRAEAEASLAKVQAAGYREARIFTNN